MLSDQFISSCFFKPLGEYTLQEDPKTLPQFLSLPSCGPACSGFPVENPPACNQVHVTGLQEEPLVRACSVGS